MRQFRARVQTICQGLDIFQATLQGVTYRDCHDRYGPSTTRCHQLTGIAKRILTIPGDAWEMPVPEVLAKNPAECRTNARRTIEIDRQYRDFWLGRIAVAKARLRPCEKHNSERCNRCRVYPGEWLRLNSQSGESGRPPSR